MEDFRHCVWLCPVAGHPWHGFIAGVPAHVTVGSYLSTNADARRVAAQVDRPIVIERTGPLYATEVNGFHALVQDVAPVGRDHCPDWWPDGAHVSFGYQYNRPHSTVEVAAIERKLAAAPKKATLSVVRCTRGTGHFSKWEVLGESEL